MNKGTADSKRRSVSVEGWVNKGTADSMRRSINDEIAYEVSPKGVYMRAHRWKPHSVSKSKEHGRMYHGSHIPD